MKSGYLVKEGIKSVWHNRLMSLASIAVLTCCLMLIGVASLFYVNVNSVMKFIEDQNELVVYVDDNATSEQQSAIASKVASDDRILSYYFVDKAAALEEVKQQFSDDADLLSGYEENNPFPASYRIKLDNLETMVDVMKTYSAMGGVEKVNAPTNVADTLISVQRMVTTTCIAFIAILIGVSLLIISNTIRITVFSRRREINIMKYVGATNWFIRIPFLIEGMTIGLISALLAYGIVWGGYAQITKIIAATNSAFIANTAQSIIPFSRMWYNVLIGFLGGGILTGMIGSATSMQKHLEV